MIIVEGWVRVEDAAEIDRLRSAAIEMMRATKAEEPGMFGICIRDRCKRHGLASDH